MLGRMRGVFGTLSMAVEIAYKLSQGLDYKTLNKYILKINKLTDIEDIIAEASRCLNDILRYDIFAFGIKHDGMLKIWMDPRVEDKEFIERIRLDLKGQNCDVKIDHIRGIYHSGRHLIDFNGLQVMPSFVVKCDKVDAVLYILPGRKMLRYHDEIIDAVLNAIGIALDNAICMKELESAAFMDTLTGCYNRRALNAFIDHDIADALRYGRKLSVIMFDIDYFKKINDGYGHEAGDRVLAEVAGMVSSTVRKSDYLARYGGEEFMLVLPNTELHRAVELSNRLRKKIESLKIAAGDELISVTASFGVADIREGYNRTRLFLDADRMLYSAKACGRNTVVHDQVSAVSKNILIEAAAC